MKLKVKFSGEVVDLPDNTPFDDTYYEEVKEVKEVKKTDKKGK